MVEVVSLVLSLTSLVGVIATAIFGYLNYNTQYLQRRSESQRLIQKYKDPLLLAAADLQSRIYNILSDKKENQQVIACDENDVLEKQRFLFTFYVFGQLLSWIYILRRQTQFLCFSLEEKNKELAICLNTIRKTLARDKYNEFMLWRGQQMAIGEEMTEAVDDELYSIGYSRFVRKYEEEPKFKHWFLPIACGLEKLMEARKLREPILREVEQLKGPAKALKKKELDDFPLPEARLRHLHHLLVDLTRVLEPNRVRLIGVPSELCDGVLGCDCSACRRKCCF